MSQTALNLVAISIFLMTFSVLLGPLIHLSPAVPAIATFTILGIATLDNFNFQGQSGTIILDWIAGLSPQHRNRIIHHEAGHFLAAHLLNVPITDYALNAWEAWQQKQPGQGGVRFDDSQLASQLEQGTISTQILDRYCTIWMAGIVAETLVYLHAEGGADDKSKLAGVLAALGFSQSQSLQKQKFHFLQAKTLLQENWSSYEALVKAMQERASVIDCQRVIDDSGS
ncbi:ATP-dependent Zn protease [Umezakia ovalisporum]|uniref:ATP-dependent Zn protease n=1 Tax=Umezakia ovalisporum FSS-43 TaxID=2740520 RepID=A0ABT6K1U4_9CYAN|nr:ATP-dependent Zn protease [Umezakia ovalisporum]MBI1242558.1 ATP-dependent Zn protease [Nostoc sp. RI_552]MDH6056329.1 ATP-dependent Zn protease [Umezakia ovalisporum FSS-43]MDH6071038.1 ATP-dependent Zn protease [Umezakia ovalisporum CobakiLakeA]MDH6077262.1 ATP-dependent Zn protease [Umezakia ovalisporum FSS-45]MDH6082668.1 ATP-dependent Zn protease [Umezakia ovalisporum FSS-44]